MYNFTVVSGLTKLEPWEQFLYPVYHRAMWHWLSENPGKTKRDWPHFERDGHIAYPIVGCFACKVSVNQNCRGCPIRAKMGCVCKHYSSPYTVWSTCTTEINSYRYAGKKVPQRYILEASRAAALIRDAWDPNWLETFKESNHAQV